MRAQFICLYLCVLSLFLGLGLQSAAQPTTFPFSQRISWEEAETDNFRIYYPAGHKIAAERVARYAERARYEIGVLMDYRPTGIHHLVYVPQSEAALFTDLAFEEPEDAPGLFNVPTYYSVVVHPATTGALYQEVKAQTARAILKEFTYGYQLGNVLQKQVLLYDADWFSEGLADFIGYGWTYEDEQLLSTLTSYELLELAQEGKGPLARAARKSIWHFITHEYGEQKISEILYLVNISHAIESGVISVLGITMNILTDRWQQYLQARFRTQQRDRVELSTMGDAIPLPPHEGDRAVSVALHPDGQWVALAFEREGQQRIWLYDLEARRYKNTPLVSGVRRGDAHALDVALPIAWSHDGEWLATTQYTAKGYFLAFWNHETEEFIQEELAADVAHIDKIAWSSDDRRLAYAVLRKGQRDIYVGTFQSSSLQPLTYDAFDDRDPAWSLDDQFIFFSSNRDTLAHTSDLPAWNLHEQHFDVFKLVLPTDSKETELIQLTKTPDVDEWAPQPISSFEVMYLSNESGIRNLKMVNIFQMQSEHWSDLAVGITAYQTNGKQAVTLQPLEGRQVVFVAPLNALRSTLAPTPTLLRLAVQARYQKKQQLLDAEKAATAAIEPEPEPKPKAPAPKPEAPKEEPELSEPAQSAVRYYIFDDEESEPYEVRKPSTPSTDIRRQPSFTSQVLTNVFGKAPIPELEEVEVSHNGRVDIPWKTDFVGLGVHYDAFAGLGAQIGMGFSDILHRHQFQFQFTPYFNFDNYQFDASYTNRLGRIDWFTAVGSMSRQLREESALSSANTEIDSAIFRFNQLNLQAGGRYAFSSFLTAEASVGYYRINRLDQNLRRERLFANQDNLVRAGVGMRFKKVEHNEGYRYKGLEGQASINSFYSLAQQGFAFHRTRLQLAYYQPVNGRIVLATRFDGAINFPREPEQYYLGGVDSRIFRPITFGENGSNNFVAPQLDTLMYQTHFLGLATPIRGFRNAVRSGSRYIMTNVELRIPVTRIMKRSLASSRLYNLSIIPFLDVGAVWVEGNPFSQKKPTDTQFIPMGSQGAFAIKLQTLKSPFLIGFGSGLRLNLLGWSIRTDLAWGVDDYELQPPSITVSMGRDF